MVHCPIDIRLKNKRIFGGLMLFPLRRTLYDLARSDDCKYYTRKTGKYRKQLTLGKNTVGNWVSDSQRRLQTADLFYFYKNRSGRLRSQFLSQCHILSNVYSWNSYIAESVGT